MPRYLPLVWISYSVYLATVDSVCYYHAHHCALMQLLHGAPQIGICMAGVYNRLYQVPLPLYTVCSH